MVRGVPGGGKTKLLEKFPPAIAGASRERRKGPIGQCWVKGVTQYENRFFNVAPRTVWLGCLKGLGSG